MSRLHWFIALGMQKIYSATRKTLLCQFDPWEWKKKSAPVEIPQKFSPKLSDNTLPSCWCWNRLYLFNLLAAPESPNTNKPINSSAIFFFVPFRENHIGWRFFFDWKKGRQHVGLICNTPTSNEMKEVRKFQSQAELHTVKCWRNMMNIMAFLSEKKSRFPLWHSKKSIFRWKTNDFGAGFQVKGKLIYSFLVRPFFFFFFFASIIFHGF